MVGVKRGRKYLEHQNQVKVVQKVRAFYPGVIIAAIPNGGDRTASERVRLASEGVLAGMPDLCVLRPSRGFHGLFVEMKTVEGVVSAAQKDISGRLNAEGYLCLVARGADDAYRLIEEYLA